MGTRRKSRELALQMLFQADLGGQTPEQVRRTFWGERADIAAEVQAFTEEIFHSATERASDIDSLLERHTEHWRMERMSAVDRNILRAGVAELMRFPETPAAVVINEALEIARRYSTTESVHFINGVLDSAARELRQTQR